MPDSLATVLVNTVIGAVPLALVAVGLNVSFALTKAFNVAHVQFATLGALVAYWCWSATSAPIWISGVAAMVVVGLVAVALRRTVIARLVRVDPTVAMIGTFALATTIQAFLQFCAGSSPRSFELPLEVGTEVFGIRVSPLQIRLVVIGVAGLALYLALLLSPLGRRIRAVAANPDLAEVSGLRAASTADAGWFIGGAMAALGGLIIGLTGGVSITLGTDLLLLAFAAAIVGGLGTLTGAIAGAFLVTFLEQAAIGFDFGGPFGTSIQLPVSLESAAVFLVLVLVLAIRPQGIFTRRVRSV